MNPWMHWLPYAGTLPFLAGMALLGGGHETLPGLGEVTPALQHYALVIIAFLAGSHWGLGVALASPLRTRLLLTSNVAALAAWGSSLWLAPPAMLSACALLLAILLVSDRWLRHAVLIEGRYWRTRVRVTLVAVSSLLAASLVVSA